MEKNLVEKLVVINFIVAIQVEEGQVLRNAELAALVGPKAKNELDNNLLGCIETILDN